MHSASVLSVLLAPSYGLTSAMEKQRLWIVDFIHTTYGKDASDVTVFGSPGFKGGGGGLYCKSTESLGTFSQMKGLAATKLPSLGTEELKGQIVRGKFLVVKSDPSKPGEKATTCFILWHEFGHALADRGVGSNANETSAWEFEIRAITQAVRADELGAFGITLDMIYGYLDVRHQGGNYSGGEAPRLVEELKVLLAEKLTLGELTEGYAYAAKTCAVDHLGIFDQFKFEKSIKARWPDLSSERRVILEKVLGKKITVW